MKRTPSVWLSVICSAACLLFALQTTTHAQTVSQQKSWWVWQGLAADGKPVTCPAGDGPSYLQIFVGDADSIGVEGAVVSLVVEDAGGCGLTSCPYENLVTDEGGYAALYPRVGLNPPTTACCTVTVSVLARFQEEDAVVILRDGTAEQDVRSWRSYDLNGDGIVNGLSGWGDYATFASDYNTTACRSDFNGDGTVNLPDNTAILNHRHPALSVSSSELDFGHVAQGTSPSMVLTLENLGGLSVGWQLTESCPWLEITPGSGSLPAPDQAPPDPDSTVEVSFDVDATGLEPGHYEYPVVVESNSPYECFTDHSVLVSMDVVPMVDDDFAYPDGDLNGNDGWAAYSAEGVKPILVISGEVRSQSSPTDGEDCGRTFAAQPADAKTYFSFKLRVPSTGPEGPAVVQQPINSVVSLYNTEGDILRSVVGVGIPYYQGDYSLQIYAGVGASYMWDGDLMFDQTYDVVAAYDAYAGTHELWLNPTDEMSEHLTAPEAESAGTSVDAVVIRQRNVTGATRCYHFIDDLKVGTSFETVYSHAPVTWYVPDDAATIAEALGLAHAGDTVILRTGTYFEYELTMVSGITLRGETNDPADVTINGSSGWIILSGSSLDDQTLVRGITFTEGFAPAGGGGAMDLSDSYLNVEDCAFTNNGTYMSNGGAVMVSGGAPAFLRCSFNENGADGDGGAMYVTSSATPTVTDCVFKDNGAFSGGALIVDSGDADLTGCTFRSNYAANGGAIRCDGGGTVLIEACTFHGNVANGGEGSAIDCVGDKRATVTVTNAIFAFGNAPSITCSGTGNVALACCDVYGNTGGDYVGCIAEQGSINDNFSANPYFCDAEGGDLRVHQNSACADAPGCGLVGALGVGCGPHVIQVPTDYETVQGGIDAAAPGDTVVVLCGTYSEANIVMKSGVTLRSGSGDPSCVTIDAESYGRILTGADLDASTRIEGITFTGGHDSTGAAMYLENSSPAIVNCVFADNYGYDIARGGAIYALGGAPVFTGCEFSGNRSDRWGGGAYLVGATASFSECRFTGNNSEWDGGGMWLSEASVVSVDHTLFSENWSSNSAAGAIACTDTSAMIITATTFYGNDAPGGGGAMLVVGFSTAVVESTIIAFNDGAWAVQCTVGDVTLACCDVYGNVGGDYVSCLDGQYGVDGNISEDPLFCGDANPDNPFALQSLSPCAAENNPGCGPIGAYGVGCAGLVDWDGGGDGFSWEDPDNWDPDLVPAEGEHARIILDGTYTVRYNSVSDIWALTNGASSGTQTLDIESGVLAVTHGALNTQEIVVRDDAAFDASVGRDSSVVVNETGATFTLDDGDLIGTGRFINRGLVEKIGPATSHVAITLENQEFARGGMGTVEAEAGTLSLDGETNSDGRLNVNSGATAIVSEHFIRGGRQSSGSLTNRGVVTVAPDGRLGADAALAIANEASGVVTLEDGDLVGSGRFANLGLVRKIGSGTSHVLLTFDNLVEARGGVGTVEAEAGTLSLDGETNSDGRINVNSGATAIVSQHFIRKGKPGRQDAAFDNTGDVAVAPGGRFLVDPTGSVWSSGTFDASGRINVASGASFASEGDLVVRYGGALLAAGEVSNEAGGNLINNGLAHVPDGGLLTNNGYLEHRENALLKGSGTIDSAEGVAAIKGLVAPGDSHGTLTYIGDFVQAPTSEISFEIGGYDQGVSYDLLDIIGAATFNGAIDVSFTGGFVPVLDDSFQLITQGDGREGHRIDFDCFAGLIVSESLYMQPIQREGEFLLRAVGGSTGNARPVATDDVASVIGYEPVTIDVLANDTDPDFDPLRVIILNLDATEGAAYIGEGDSLVSYTAIPGFAGADTFDYVVTDCLGGSDTGRVVINVVAPPDVWRVPDDSPTIAGALALASPGDTVVVACGTYHESNITVPSGVTLVSETGAPECVVIDGSGRAGRVLYCEDAGGTTAIRGITVTGGSTSQFGGGLCCVRSSPHVIDCAFMGNAAQSGGGIACDDHSSGTFVGCRISANNSAVAGGVLCYNNSSPSFTGCVIANNVTPSGGGGIQCVAFSSPTFTGCTVVGNAAPLGGGSGLYTGDDSHPVFDHTIMAFGVEGEAVVCGLTGTATLGCSDVYGNEGGDWIGCIAGQAEMNGNFSLDPAFCNLEMGDYYVEPSSPCADALGCGLVGALEAGCFGDPGIYVEPDSLVLSVGEGDTASAFMVISNYGRGSVEWLIRENGPARGDSNGRVAPSKLKILPRHEARALEPLRPAIPHVEVEKGESDPREGRCPTRGAGGPEGFGYTWIDNDEPFGPTYDWREISGVGTALALPDDGSQLLALPFAFPFYASLKSFVRVSSNGYLTFSPMGADYSNDPIPDSWVPNDLVAPFWDDLNPTLGGAVYYYHDAVREEFVVEYDGVYDYYGAGPYTFEVVLTPAGRILFLYDEIAGEPHQATVGIENEAGTEGLEIAFNAPYAHSRLAVLIEDPAPWLTETPPRGVTDGLGSVSVTLEVGTEGLMPGLHLVTLVVESNDPEDPEVMIPVSLMIGGTDVDGALPTRYVLHGNYPNPFNPRTEIRYDLPAPAVVSLRVYSIAGRLVRELVVDEREGPGRYAIPWDGRDDSGERVASGVYYYKLEADGEKLTNRMVLLK